MRSCSSFIPPPLLLLLVISFAIWVATGLHLINSTCSASARDDPNIDYNFCVTSLQAVPGSRCATLQGLGNISIALLLHNVTDTSRYIKGMLRNRAWDPYLRQCLSDCSEVFSDAISSVEQAAGDYEARRFDDANVQISSVMDAADTCEDGFKERGGVVLPLTKRNNDTFQLSAVVLSVMWMVQKGSAD